MKRRFVFAALAASVLASCNESVNEISVSQEETVGLKVTVTDGTTKAMGLTGENFAKNLQVFVFGENGMLEAYESATNSASLTVGVFSGTKTIHALLNAPAFTNVLDYEDLYSSISKLEDNDIDCFVMEGWKQETIGPEGKTVTVELKRMVAKVSLLEVRNQLSENFKDLKLTVKGSYLINIAGDRAYGAEGHEPPLPQVWYNQMKRNPDEPHSSLTYDSYNDAVLNHGEVFNVPHYFYCYPNPTVEDTSEKPWSPRHTRLVFEAMLGETLYYYPVTLPVLEQNTEYQVTLTITRPGSTDPDVPFSPDAADVKVRIVDWTAGGSIDEII